ncbi:MAG TPA: hypothetical protein VNZ04_09425 [Trinickia sp.]|jgi:hypothetical protein|nr:hypothetical protein [Trinickia sp.]
MKFERIFSVRPALSLLLVSALLGGCMSSSPIWDAHFGESVKAITQAQIIDPQAGEHNPSTSGVDGKAAVSAMTAYGKSFDAPAPTTNNFVIGIGSGGNSGQ